MTDEQVAPYLNMSHWALRRAVGEDDPDCPIRPLIPSKQGRKALYAPGDLIRVLAGENLSKKRGR